MEAVEHRFCCGIRDIGQLGGATSVALAIEYVKRAFPAIAAAPERELGKLFLVSCNTEQMEYVEAFKSLGWTIYKTWININSSNRCYLLGKVV